VSQRWLELCAAELRRRRVPRRVAAGLLGELREHFADLLEEGSMSEVAMELRMGEPEAVAERAAVEHRCRPGRGKWLALGAVPAFVGGVILAGLIPVGLMAVLTAVVPENEEWASRLDNHVAAASAWWLRTVPWLIAGAMLCRWAVRIQARRPWLTAAYGQLALLAASFLVTFQPKTADGLGQLMIGLRFPPTPALSQLPALALVCLFAFVAWRRTTSPSPQWQ